MEKKLVLQAITAKEVELFRQATLTESEGFPLTFPTRFRALEFALMKDLKVNLQQLLHTDQSYVYESQLNIGDIPEISTRVKEDREKRGMRFVVLETTVHCAGKIKVVSECQMVIRSKEGGSE